MLAYQDCREKWLQQIAYTLEQRYFNDATGYRLPAYRVSCGFPKGTRRPSQTWSATQSTSGHFEIFISPEEDNTQRVAVLLAHELVHAATKQPTRHTPEFIDIAKFIGLEGAPSRPAAGKRLRDQINDIVDALGEYPHSTLNPKLARKQGTRQIKLTCPGCAMVIRTTQKWLVAIGAPTCACTRTFAPEGQGTPPTPPAPETTLPPGA